MKFIQGFIRRTKDSGLFGKSVKSLCKAKDFLKSRDDKIDFFSTANSNQSFDKAFGLKPGAGNDKVVVKSLRETADMMR